METNKLIKEAAEDFIMNMSAECRQKVKLCGYSYEQLLGLITELLEADGGDVSYFMEVDKDHDEYYSSLAEQIFQAYDTVDGTAYNLNMKLHEKYAPFMPLNVDKYGVPVSCLEVKEVKEDKYPFKWDDLTELDHTIIENWVQILNKTMPEHLVSYESYVKYKGLDEEIPEDSKSIDGKIPMDERDFWATTYKRFLNKANTNKH